MAEFYQGQRARNPQTGETIVYDAKKGWQAVDAQTNPAYRDALKAVSTERTATRRLQGQNDLLQQADRMLGDGPGRVNSGGILNNVTWPFSLTQAVSKDADKFDNLGKRIQTAGGNPAQGQGAVSDYERRLFSAGAPSLQNFNDTNRDLIGQRQALVNEQRDYAVFLDDYVKRKGSAEGAQEVWQDYVAQDPYYGPSRKNPERFVAKTKDPGRWRRFIYGGAKVAPQGATDPAALKSKYGLE